MLLLALFLLLFSIFVFSFRFFSESICLPVYIISCNNELLWYYLMMDSAVGVFSRFNWHICVKSPMFYTTLYRVRHWASQVTSFLPIEFERSGEQMTMSITPCWTGNCGWKKINCVVDTPTTESMLGAIFSFYLIGRCLCIHGFNDLMVVW